MYIDIVVKLLHSRSNETSEKTNLIWSKNVCKHCFYIFISILLLFRDNEVVFFIWAKNSRNSQIIFNRACFFFVEEKKIDSQSENKEVKTFQMMDVFFFVVVFFSLLVFVACVLSLCPQELPYRSQNHTRNRLCEDEITLAQCWLGNKKLTR